MYRLIYKSKANGVIDKESFRDILYTSVQLNRTHGVNGALIATDNYFLQILEGSSEIVHETFARIKDDPRHIDVKIITSESITEAKFADWRMRGFGLFGLNLELEVELKKKFGEQDDSIFLPEDKEKVFELIHDLDMIDTLSLDVS